MVSTPLQQVIKSSSSSRLFTPLQVFKMSAIENSNAAALHKIIATAQAALAALGVETVTSKVTKGKGKKAGEAKTPKVGGAHAAWTAKITAEWKSVKDAFTAERVAAAEAGTLLYTADSMAVKQGKHSVGEAYTVEGAKAGIHLVWGSLQRQVRAAEYESFIAEWKAAHPSGSAAPSEPSSSAASVADNESVAESESSSKKRGPKKLADMTPEELAAHKSKVAARKTAKTAAKDAEAETAAPAAPIAVADVPAPVAAPAPEPVAAPVAEEDEGAELLPFTFERRKCVRYGTMSGNTIEWATGDIWESKKGAKGTYLGCLSDDETTLDTEADEPEFD
jgi:hypothetical protein